MEKRTRVAIDDLILDVEAATVLRGTEQIPLQGLSFDLLVCLTHQAPLVATHDAILDALWPGAHVGEETLKQRVRLLRKALGDDSKAPRYIQTVRGRGYKLLPKVVPLNTVHSVQSVPAARKRRRWLPLAAIPLLTMIVWLFLLWSSPRTVPTTMSTSEVPDADLKAGDLYQRALTYYSRYQPRDNETAISLLKRAVAADPDSASSYALLSRAYSQQPKLGNGYWGEEALAAAETAISIDPNEVEAFSALGLYHDVSGQPLEAIDAYEKALRLKPDHASVTANIAHNLMLRGQLVEALRLNLKAYALNGDIQFVKIQIGDTLRFLGFEENARAWLEKSVTLQPDNTFARLSFVSLLLVQGKHDDALAQLESAESYAWNEQFVLNSRGDVHFFRGELEAARDCFQRSWQNGDPYGGTRLALVLFAMDDVAFADVFEKLDIIFQKEKMAGRINPEYRLNYAGLLALKSRADEALGWLDSAFETGWCDVRWLELDPGLAGLRQVDGFEESLDQLKTRVAAMRTQVRNENLIP